MSELPSEPRAAAPAERPSWLQSEGQEYNLYRGTALPVSVSPEQLLSP